MKPTRAKLAKKQAQVDQAHKQRQEVEFLQDLSGLHGKFIEKDDRAHACGRWTPSELDLDGLVTPHVKLAFLNLHCMSISILHAFAFMSMK